MFNLQDLFRGAILESGTALVHGSYIMYAKNYAFQLGKLLDGNFTSSSSKALLKILRSTPADVILAASDKVSDNLNLEIYSFLTQNGKNQIQSN